MKTIATYIYGTLLAIGFGFIAFTNLDFIFAFLLMFGIGIFIAIFTWE